MIEQNIEPLKTYLRARKFINSNNYIKYNRLFSVKDINAIIEVDKEKLNHLWFTLSDFYIASSSKSYLLINKYYDYCSYDSIKYILQAGARFIELDIFRKGLNEHENEPVVTNGESFGEWKKCINDLCLRKCLETILENGFKDGKDSDPLILYLNININSEVKWEGEGNSGTWVEHYGDWLFYNKIANIVYDTFKLKLLDTERSWQHDIGNIENEKKTNPIHLEDIFEFCDKIIIMSNVTGSCSNLSELINIVAPRNIKNNKNSLNIDTFTNKDIVGAYDVDSLKIGNKNKLSYVYEESDTNKLTNYSSGQAFDTGCQIISMYYQANDNNLYNYMNSAWTNIPLYNQTPIEKSENITSINTTFNNCSFILKPVHLRNSLKDLVNNTHNITH